MWNLNAITPETETTSHYFWGQAHNFDVHNPKTTDMITDQIRMAFLEDVAVFEAQQRNLQLIPNPPQTDINADSGVIQARRILDRLYQEEQTAARGEDGGGGVDASQRSASPFPIGCVTRAGPGQSTPQHVSTTVCGFLASGRVPRHDGLCRGPQRADAAPLIKAPGSPSGSLPRPRLPAPARRRTPEQPSR